MANASGGFIWYELMTPDPAGSKTFYDSVVGWSVEAEPSGPIDYRMIARADGGHAGGVLRLTPDMQRHGARPCWIGYLHVPNVDAAAEAILRDGGSSLLAPTDIPDVGRMAMMTDPSGAAFYIMSPKPPAARPDAVSDVFSVDRPQRVRWNELSTSDPAGAVAFYTRHFGWVQEGDMDMGPIGKYQFIHQGGTRIGAIMPRMPQTRLSMWTFYIGVDDIDRAAAATEAGGGRILNGPHQIPGGEYSLNAIDPQGASFGLVGPRHH